MQSNAGRALVAIGSIAAIVVLFVVFSGADDGEEAAEPAAETTSTEAANEGQAEQPPERTQPEFETIVVAGGEPKGGVAELSYEKGDRVRLRVRSDVDEHVHVHGYDLFEDVPAGGKAEFSFVAEIDGVFEIELEDSGVPLAELRVKP